MLRRWIGPLVGFLVMLLAAVDGRAQTCTLGPYCSTSCGGGTVQTVSQIQTAISNAAAGSVVCLQRGQEWSSGSTLSLNTNFPGNDRVTVCASTASSCSGSGAANPRITITSATGCVLFNNGSGGYTVHDLDCYNTSSASSAAAFDIRKGANNVTLSGVLSDGFFQGINHGIIGGATLPDNIRVGECGGVGKWMEIRNGPATNPGGDRQAQEGGCTNCAFALNVHDFRAYAGPNFITSHLTDLLSAESPGQVWNQAGVEHDVVYECGRYEWTSGAFGSVAMKLDRGWGHIIRNNYIDGGTTSNPVIAIGGHANDGQEGISGSGVPGAGMRIYDNVVVTGGGLIINEMGQDVDVYRNLLFLHVGGGQRGVIQFGFNAGQDNGAEPDDLCAARTRLFHNTAYVTGPGGSSGFNHFAWDNPGLRAGCSAGLSSGNNALGNNVIHLAKDGTDEGAKVLAAINQGCGGYGGNCANVQGNFLYSADSTPGLLNGSADDDWTAGGPSAGDDPPAGSAGDIGELPGLNGKNTAYAGGLDGLVLAMTPEDGSNLCGRGVPSICAYQDGLGFGGVTRTTCDPGAIPCGGAVPATPRNRGKRRITGGRIAQLLDAPLFVGELR